MNILVLITQGTLRIGDSTSLNIGPEEFTDSRFSFCPRERVGKNPERISDNRLFDLILIEGKIPWPFLLSKFRWHICGLVSDRFLELHSVRRTVLTNDKLGR